MEWEEARQRLDKRSAVALDIRTLSEHRERRIPGSLHLNYMELNQQTARRVLGRTGLLVLVYCRSGRHSSPVAEKLRRYGYNAIDMGSIDDWQWALEGTLV